MREQHFSIKRESPFTLAELASTIEAKVKGDPNCLIYRISPLETAQNGDITIFLNNQRYKKFLFNTQASAVVLEESCSSLCSVNALLTPEPKKCLIQLLKLFFPQKEQPTSGIHESVVLGSDCRIDETASIGPGVVIGNKVVIHAGVRIGANVSIGDYVSIGSDTIINSNATLYPGVKIGTRCLIHSGAVLGADGFGFIKEGQKWINIPQVGGLIIGDDAEIGANTTIDRGALGNTVIGNGVKIDNLVMIGHNGKIGDHTIIAGCTGIAGSVTIGAQCMIGGKVAINDHVDICDNTMITANTGVSKSIKEPGIYSSGVPIAQKNLSWRKNVNRFIHLDEFARRVKRLENLYGEQFGNQSD